MKNNNIFNGYIKISDMFFNSTIDKHNCLIFPQYPFNENGYRNPLPDKVNELAGLSSLKGVYGLEPENFTSRFSDFYTDSGISAKLLISQMPKPRYLLSPDATSCQFYSSLIVMPRDKANYPLNLSFFDAILFSGESINLAYNPKFAVKPLNENDLHEHVKAPGKIDIKIKPFEAYTRDFDVIVAGVKAKLKYSITANNEQWKLDTNNLGVLNSNVRIYFKDKQPLEMISKCYLQLRNFLQFLLGRQNVGFNVQLQQRIKNMSEILQKQSGEQNLKLFSNVAEVYISDGYEDYCDARYDHTIQFKHLNDDLPKLFNLFSVKRKQPYLPMLPVSNDRAKFISYTDVGDICTSLEIEYEIKKYKAPTDDFRNSLVERLQAAVKEYQESENKPDTDLYNSALGSIEHIKLPLKERIIYLWEKSLSDDFNDDEKANIKSDIEKFVKMRNRITHTGKIEWGDNRITYIRLLRTLYYCILIRAKFSDKNAKIIAKQKFQYDHLLF